MKRTQIQLPDRLYERLMAQASYEESTLAELMRKAGEYYLSVNPSRASRSRPWIPPVPRNLGAFLAPEDRWRELAQDVETAP